MILRAAHVLFGLALFLLVSGPVSAASLLSIDAGRSGDTVLLTLQFDESLPLRLAASAGLQIELSADGPLDNTATAPQLPPIQRMELIGDRLRVVCAEPVRASLRPAGAGRYLLVLRPDPTAAPARSDPPVTPPAESAASESPDSDTPPADENQPSESESPARKGDMGARLLIEAARIQAEEGDLDAALRSLESVEETSPRYGLALLLKGDLEKQQGDRRQAEKTYRKAMDEPGSEGAAAGRLALMKQEDGEEEDAASFWEKLLASGDPSVPPLVEEQGGDGAVSSSGDQPLAMGDGAGDQASYGEAAKTSGGPIKFEANSEPVSFMNTRLMAVVTLLLLLVGGLITVFIVLRNRRIRDEKEFRSRSAELDDVFWGDEPPDMKQQPDELDSSAGQRGALEAELEEDDSPPPVEEEPPPPRKPAQRLSDEKRRRIRDLQAQGFTVREIAESTGSSQDEVRMAMQMQEAGGGS